MKISANGYSFEVPDNWEGIVGIKNTRGGVVFRLLWEEERSGIIAVIKPLKRRSSRSPEGYELLGTLTDPEGCKRSLFAVYGEEDACGEDNADLYFRLFDRMYNVYKSIVPAPGYKWEPAEGLL